MRLILMCVNSGMKILENKEHEISTKYQTVLAERNSLMNLIAVTTDIPIEGDAGSIDHIKDILLHHLNSYKIKNKELSDKIFALEDKLESYARGGLVSTSLEDSVDGVPVRYTKGDQIDDIQRLEEKNGKLRNKVYLLEMSMHEKNTKIAYLEKKIDMVSEGRTGDTDTLEDSDSTRLKRGTVEVKRLQNTIDEQKRNLAVAHAEVDKLRRSAIEADRKGSASSLLKAEQEALLFSLRKDLTAALHMKEIHERKIKELEEYRIRTEGKLCNLVDNKDKLSQSEDKMDEASSLITRLQGQLQATETNLAIRATAVANSEEQVCTLKQDLAKREEQVAIADNMVVCLRQQLVELESKSSIEKNNLEIKFNAIKCELENATQKHLETEASLRKSFDGMINEMKKESMKKAHTARVLLDEKVEAIKILTERNVSLKEEIESGHPADRKIFELASKQASRDANMHTTRYDNLCLVSLFLYFTHVVFRTEEMHGSLLFNSFKLIWRRKTWILHSCSTSTGSCFLRWQS